MFIARVYRRFKMGALPPSHLADRRTQHPETRIEKSRGVAEPSLRSIVCARRLHFEEPTADHVDLFVSRLRVRRRLGRAGLR